MNHQTYINKAVKLAQDNVQNGGKPFGAVIVKDDTVIATGINKAVQTGDTTSHAETEAIRKAGIEGKSNQLKGATLYASGHPCPMCLAASYLAGIEEIYYDSTLDEAEKVGLGVSHIYEELRKNLDQQKLPLRQFSSTIEVNPIKQWADSEK
ncbi:nucleoside deaminase [Fodinibius sediminis]|uniref:tRNA(Arg) A34 adenosine deaminase TadA n=1 Tax=Fodinibius sediminis TaxID=1214077 RepID=A0A521EQJ2_9BACT|nr:nucleoside deaminase [Fodinibius sediminis]SMO86198.1 tRNA(Arg) A34 adenosine deaminase TadA [Fodinibius sediminis]